mmetsp:Transcript_2154/g.6387  ORF Transcript_2154/g.6387 Transcript_2154/m.6387 type:complete len:266 (-) Transcript_2154:267-1064(-)
MTTRQVAIECEANRLVAPHDEAAVEALERDDEAFRASALSGIVRDARMTSYETGEEYVVERPSSGTSYFVETGSRGSNLASPDLATIQMPLSRGPVVLPVAVSGLPVLAFLSNTSPYTIVSKGFADAAGLWYEPLRKRHGCGARHRGRDHRLQTRPPIGSRLLHATGSNWTFSSEASPKPRVWTSTSPERSTRPERRRDRRPRKDSSASAPSSFSTNSSSWRTQRTATKAFGTTSPTARPSYRARRSTASRHLHRHGHLRGRRAP